MKKLLSLFAAILFAAISFANVDEVTLVVNGIAHSKDEAIARALRSAVEQSFGTFISSNTKIVNDNLTKDEIVSISSGNIKKYDELSSLTLPNGDYSVTLKAIVSIKHLTSFARSYGSSCEFAGNTFSENMQLRELYKENEKKVIDNLLEQLTVISKNLYDLDVSHLGTPQEYEGVYRIPIYIKMSFNKNTNIALTELLNTLNSISLSEKEKQSYKSTNTPYYRFTISSNPRRHTGSIEFYLRNKFPAEKLERIFNSHLWQMKVVGLYDNNKTYRIADIKDTNEDNSMKEGLHFAQNGGAYGIVHHTMPSDESELAVYHFNYLLCEYRFKSPAEPSRLFGETHAGYTKYEGKVKKYTNYTKGVRNERMTFFYRIYCSNEVRNEIVQRS